MDCLGNYGKHCQCVTIRRGRLQEIRERMTNSMIWKSLQTHTKGLGLQKAVLGYPSLCNQTCASGRVTGQQCACRTDQTRKRLEMNKPTTAVTLGRGTGRKGFKHEKLSEGENDRTKCQPAGWDKSVCSLSNSKGRQQEYIISDEPLTVKCVLRGKELQW